MSEEKNEVEGLVLAIRHPDFSNSEECAKEFIEGMALGWARAMKEQDMRRQMIVLDPEASEDSPAVHLFFPYDDEGIAAAEKAAAFVMMSTLMGALTYMDPVVTYDFTVQRGYRAQADRLTSMA